LDIGRATSALAEQISLCIADASSAGRAAAVDADEENHRHWRRPRFEALSEGLPLKSRMRYEHATNRK